MSSRAYSIVGYRSEGRPENDFYRTPEDAVMKLLNVEGFNNYIWEPACGDGAISEVLKRNGFNVFSSDISGLYGIKIDFLRTTNIPRSGGDIITNPPFKLANEFIQHANDLGARKFVFLLKLAALEGSKRSKLMEETKLTRVHVFRSRLTMTRAGELSRNGGMIAFAWFVWERGNKKPPQIGWL